MKIKVYIAAPFKAQADMRNIRFLLQEAGYEVTSRWLDVERGEVDFETNIALHKSISDLEDIDNSNVVLINTYADTTTGGFNVELGYSLGKAKIIIHMGPRRNIFFKHPDVVHCQHLSDVLKTLESIQPWLR